MPPCDSNGPLKSAVSLLKNLRFLNCQAIYPKFVFDPEARVLKIEGSSFEINPPILGLKVCYKVLLAAKKYITMLQK